MFQWFTVGLFSKYTKNENILLYDGCFPLQEKKKKKKKKLQKSRSVSDGARFLGLFWKSGILPNRSIMQN